jgi:MFS family permease
VIAAGLIELLGPVNSFWLPASLFVVAAISVAAMRVGDGGQAARAEREEAVTGVASLFRGFTALWMDRPLRLLTFSVLLISAVYWPTETVVLPTHFNALESAASLGIVISALAGGSMVGAFAYGWISKRLRPSTLVRCIMIGTSLSMLPMALLPPLPIMVAFAFLLGLSWGPFDPLMSTLVQTRIPADEHGRVYGAQLSAFYAAPPLGMVVAGFSVDRFGVGATYLVLAGLVTVAAIRIIPSKSVRELDHE